MDGFYNNNRVIDVIIGILAVKATQWLINYIRKKSFNLFLYKAPSEKTICDSPTNVTDYHNVGSCKIFFGPMFSSKTTHLIKEICELADIGYKTLYINYRGDTREGEDNVSTHHSGFRGLSDKITSIKAGNLAEVNVSEYKCIGIDEGQFFPDLNEYVRKWVLEDRKDVVIATLDGNYKAETFGEACKLIPICDPGNIVKLGAVCQHCREYHRSRGRTERIPAGFTGRIINQGDEILIGGKESYMPLCMKCYRKHIE